jgi:hypothetical protein
MAADVGGKGCVQDCLEGCGGKEFLQLRESERLLAGTRSADAGDVEVGRRGAFGLAEVVETVQAVDVVARGADGVLCFDPTY